MQSFFLIAMKIIAWLVALAWASRSLAAHFGLPKVPNLLLPGFDLSPPGDPTLTVIVPARDEGANIRACLESLLTQDYPHLQIVAVNDRSSDQTGAIMDELASSHPERLTVLHIQELAPGWLGKTHAMAVAAKDTSTDFLLFTDADIIFAPTSLRRALANVQANRADHLVLMPTTIIRRWDEAALLGFFQTFGVWGPRIWRVQDPSPTVTQSASAPSTSSAAPPTSRSAASTPFRWRSSRTSASAAASNARAYVST